jgi:lipid-binding SYLF domain-containing protein
MAGLVLGVQRGYAFLIARTETGEGPGWSAPVFFSLSEVSFGLTAGALAGRGRCRSADHSLGPPLASAATV